jgi:hypothetical protein
MQNGANPQFSQIIQDDNERNATSNLRASAE